MQTRDMIALAVIAAGVYWLFKPGIAHAATVVTNADGSTTVLVNGQAVPLPAGLSIDDPLVQSLISQAAGTSGGSSAPVNPTVTPNGGGASW